MIEKSTKVSAVNINDITYYKAQIQTQSYCNSSCIMCPYSDTSKILPQGKMSWELFCRIIDDIISVSSIKHVVLMLQNEPLLDEKLPDKIRYVKKKNSNINISISTNGFYLTKKFLELLVDAGLNFLIFSINGFRKETFEKVEMGIDYETVFSNLYYLIENKPSSLNVTVKCMIVNNNVLELGLPDHFSDLPKLLKEKNIGLDIGPISNRAGALKNYKELIVLANRQSSRNKILCDDIFNSLNILYSGDVIGCCADWMRKSILGNLQKQTIREIWNSEEAIMRRKIILAGEYKNIQPCNFCSQAKNIMLNLEK
jgi:MoaA/NifB/PqqE/SkfB family radical SAM enzyme